MKSSSEKLSKLAGRVIHDGSQATDDEVEALAASVLTQKENTRMAIKDIFKGPDRDEQAANKVAADSAKASNAGTAEETKTADAERRPSRASAKAASSQDEVTVSLRMIYERKRESTREGEPERVVPFAQPDRDTVLYAGYDAPAGGREFRMSKVDFLDLYKRVDDEPTVGRNI